MVSLKHKLIVALCGTVLMPLLALGQESGSDKSEVVVEGFLPIVKSTTASGLQQSSSINGGVLAGYRFFFGTHTGVELSYGYSRSTQTYDTTNGQVGLGANSNDIFAAFVYRFSHKRLSPFLLAGAGALLFDPRAATGVGVQARAGYLYGGGADFQIGRRLFVRAEYRGTFYDSPTFAISALNGLDRFTHRAEPAIGFGYKF
jgi:opacity protein-like surface antigen